LIQMILKEKIVNAIVVLYSRRRKGEYCSGRIFL
jgi:hypothetical protein